MRAIGRDRAMMIARTGAAAKSGDVCCCVCTVRSSGRGLF